MPDTNKFSQASILHLNFYFFSVFNLFILLFYLDFYLLNLSKNHNYMISFSCIKDNNNIIYVLLIDFFVISISQMQKKSNHE